MCKISLCEIPFLKSGGKRAATLTTFVLMVGMIFVSMAAIGVLRNISIRQAKTVEYDYTVLMVEQIKEVVDKANAYPDNAEYLITLKNPIKYTVNISNNKISIYFPEQEITKEIYFFSPGISVVPSSFETSGIIHVYKKDNNLYITNRLLCNTTDERCDTGCIALGLCDPACYIKNTYDVCNPYCLDKNKDKKINRYDSDNICDPDCYNTFEKQFYDIDCIDPEDGICDPSTNNIKDGICDKDCLGTNGVCDPDCDEFDMDCPHKGNGMCEPVRGENCANEFWDCNCTKTGKICKAECGAFIAQNKVDDFGCIAETEILKEGAECIEECQCSEGLICDTKFGTMHCCPKDHYYDKSSKACVHYKKDGKCSVEEPHSENCENSPNDCRCEQLNLGECCTNCLGALPNGCCDKGTIKCNGKCKKIDALIGEGQKCECDGECGKDANSKNMKCSANPKDADDKACCPEGKEWNGTKCEQKCTFTLLFIQLNSNIQNFDSKAKEGTNVWISISPLKNCPQKVCYIADSRICYGDVLDAFDPLKRCANDWGYAGKYDRIVGVAPGQCIAQVSGGCIRGYTLMYNDIVVSAETSIRSTCSHELGHTFGLCDEGYGGGTCNQCPSGWHTHGGIDCYPNCAQFRFCCPNVPEQNSLMCSSDPCNHGCSAGDYFASTSYAHLETELSGYCS